MQIVIDIPEDVYTRLFDNGIQDNEIAVDDVCEMAMAIRKGTPLPKGHGRLIDAWMYFDIPDPYKASPTSCSNCILDNTDACTRGAGRAVDDEACEDYLASPTGAESEDV